MSTATLKSTLDDDAPVYTMAVAVELTKTHPRTLMSYENLGLIHPARTRDNRRRFTPRDIAKVRALRSLHRDHGVTSLPAARIILDLIQRIKTKRELPAELAPIAELVREN